jgi:hypothetical protein
MDFTQLKESFIKAAYSDVSLLTDVMVWADKDAGYNFGPFNARLFGALPATRVRLARTSLMGTWRVMAQYKVCANGF